MNIYEQIVKEQDRRETLKEMANVSEQDLKAMLPRLDVGAGDGYKIGFTGHEKPKLFVFRYGGAQIGAPDDILRVARWLKSLGFPEPEDVDAKDK